MIFVEWYEHDQPMRGRVLGWAHEGKMYAAVMLPNGKGCDVALSDVTFIEDVSKKQIRRRKKQEKDHV